MREFETAKQREAEEAERHRRERMIEDETRARAGDIADAHGRYAEALGRHYSIRDPYDSLARAAMAEYGTFHRQQEQLKGEIARETDPEKRKLLELRKEIEANEYMAITSQRLAGINRVVTGRNDSEQARRDEERAKAFAARASELRQERQELIQQGLEQQAGGPRTGRGEGSLPSEQPREWDPATWPGGSAAREGPKPRQYGDGATPEAARKNTGTARPTAGASTRSTRKVGAHSPGKTMLQAAEMRLQAADAMSISRQRAAATPLSAIPLRMRLVPSADEDLQQQQSGRKETETARSKASDPADKLANIEMTDRRAASLAKIRDRHQENAERSAQREQSRQMGRAPSRSR